MKLAARFVGVVGAGALVVAVPGPSSVAAQQSGAAAAATQHARDELANAVAQGKITLTPTPTPSSTATPRPTATPALTATSTPQPEPSPSPTALPALPVPPAGADPVVGYIGDLADTSGGWLELALPTGRWAVAFRTDLCTPPPPWTDVQLDPSDAEPSPQVEWGDGRCAIALAVWQSGAPCASSDGACTFAADGRYYAQLPPSVVAEALPIEAPPIDTPAPTAPPVVPTAAPRAPPAPAAPPPPQVVVQTVIVPAPAPPAPPPAPAPVPPPPAAPAPVAPPPPPPATPTPRATPTIGTLTLTRQGEPIPMRDSEAVPEPTPAPDAVVTDSGVRLSWGWLLGAAALVAGVAGGRLFLLRRATRRYL